MITYHSENISFNLKGKREINNWIKSVVSDLQFSLKMSNYKVGNINIVFCNDTYLLEINQKYLNHNYFTDIITFDYSENGIISGDLFISVDTVKENSLKFKVSFDEEIKRVIIHGVLHLLGYKDKTKSEKLKMKDAENMALSMIL